uniref:Hypoxia up-regulated protein 1 n=1 Tax=Bursaphelenchus xylophilus TaxID=6326 RepID=A0A1I7STZ0_BURXY
MRSSYTLLFAVVQLAGLGSVSNAQLAAMSVDLGDEFLKFGLVKPGVPMETVINKESRRKTPNIVAIRNGERFFGDIAAQMSIKFPANAITSYNDLIGKQFNHPLVEEYQRRFPYHKLSAHPERNTVVFEIDGASYPIETILAMALWNAQEQTSAHAGQFVKNVVISIPSYFNHSERVAVANATQIAGLNLLSLIYDGSAAALNYGVFRRKEITEKPQTLLIYDIGARKTVATLAEYKLVEEKEGSKEKIPLIKTIGVAFDRTLGGQLVTARLRDHLVNAFKEQFKALDKDITQNQRAMAKMWKEADRVKQVLSANAECFAQVESVFEDKDFKVKVSRDLVDEIIEENKDRLVKLLNQVLEQSGLDITAVDQVVLMGAGTRIPKIQKILSEAISGKELARFLNTDEAIALGAVYEAASRSKGFRVKPFRIEEKPVYPTTEEEAAFTGLTATQVTEAKRVLAEFENIEKLKVEKETALNSLESLVYDVTAKLDDETYNKFVNEEESAAIRGKAEAIRAWLEDEVTPDTDAKALKDKRSELVGESKKMNYRKRQFEERPKHYVKIADSLGKAKDLLPLFNNSTKENATIFTEEEVKKYEDEINKVEMWFSEKKKIQEGKGLDEEPVITVKEITEKIKLVNNEVSLMKSKVYLYQVKVAKEKREAEEKEKKEKEAAGKAAKNETVIETPPTTNENESSAQQPEAEETSTEAPTDSSTETPNNKEAENSEKDEKTEL